MRYMLGSLILPSHISNWQTNTIPESNMSFWRRLVNFCEVWKHMYDWVNVHIPIEDAIAKKYLGEDLPHIDDITKNMSIYLVNKHPALSYVRSELPNVIFFHGFHIAKVPPALPKVCHTNIYMYIIFQYFQIRFICAALYTFVYLLLSVLLHLLGFKTISRQRDRRVYLRQSWNQC